MGLLVFMPFSFYLSFGPLITVLYRNFAISRIRNLVKKFPNCTPGHRTGTCAITFPVTQTGTFLVLQGHPAGLMYCLA